MHVLGIDVGGTKIAAGLVKFPEGVIRERRVIPTMPGRGGAAVLDDVNALARDLAHGAEREGEPIAGIGLGVCELVNLAGEIVSANAFDWRSLRVQERMSVLAPTVIEADVRAAALAEARFGAGRGLRNFLHVTIGTGIASCLVIEGEPFRGARGLTGTMGSSPMANPFEDRAGSNTPSLEELASGPALVNRLNRLPGKGSPCAEEVIASAVAGDVPARRVIDSALGALGATLAGLINTLDPEMVVIGGGLGLGLGSSSFWETLVSETRRHIWSDLHRDLPMRAAGTGRDAGILGAGVAAADALQRAA